MNFASAITSLRDGRCAKTASMRGYVSRTDHQATETVSVVSDFAQATANPAGAVVRYTDPETSAKSFFLLPSGHAANDAWAATDSVAVTLFRLSFVENPGYVDDDDSTSSYVFEAWADSTRAVKVRSAPSADLVVDAELLGLLCSQDWEVSDTDSAASAASSTDRW